MPETNYMRQLERQGGRWLTIADSNYLDGNYFEAFDAYMEAVAVLSEAAEPIDPEVNFRIVECLAETGRPDDSKDFLGQMIELYRGDIMVESRAFFEMGKLELELEDYEAAEYNFSTSFLLLYEHETEKYGHLDEAATALLGHIATTYAAAQASKD